MKKWLLMLLSIMLIVAMAMSFAACGDKDEDEDEDETTAAAAEKDDDKGDKKPSSNKGTAGKEEAKNDSIVGSWEGTIDYTEFMEFGFDVYADVEFEFNADGTYTAVIDVVSMIDSMEENGGEILEEMAAEYGDTVGNFLEYIHISMGGQETEETAGEYSFEDGVLILDGEEMDCEFDGDELTFDLGGLPVALSR